MKTKTTLYKNFPPPYDVEVLNNLANWNNETIEMLASEFSLPDQESTNPILFFAE